jgi:hypothetical protein
VDDVVISISRHVRRVGLGIILFKAIYVVLLFGALRVWPTPKEDFVFLSGLDASKADMGFGSHLLSSDGKYYVRLSEEGYRHGNKECAFYPLYPLFIRWASPIIGRNDVLTAMVLSNLFSLVAFLLFFEMTARRYGEAVAALAVALLMAFPGSLFFQFIYTESLFFLLVMLFCYAWEWDCRALFCVTAFLMPLTRAVGVFCVFPIMWDLFFRSPPVRWSSRASQPGAIGASLRFLGPLHSNPEMLNSQTRRSTGTAYQILAPLLGWATYFLMMRKWTGNAFEGIDAQKYYGVQSIHNLFDPVRFVTQLFNPTTWHGFTGSLLDRCVFVLMIYCFPLIWKLDKSWLVWTFFLGVVPAVSGGFTSETRFVSVVFPMFVALGIWLSRPGMRWLRWITLTVFVTLHLILVWGFVNFKWAG